MARTLQQPPPSSSLARLLDTGAANRATARPDESTMVHEKDAHSTKVNDERQHVAAVKHLPAGRIRRRIKREVLLCPETEETLDELVRFLRLGTRARVTTSHLVRALLWAVAPHLAAIRLRAAQLGPQRLPSNALGCETARRQFEQMIAAILITKSPAEER